MSNTTIVPCNFLLHTHRLAVVRLLNAYMADPMGDAPPLDEERTSDLLNGLRNHGACFVFLAIHNRQFVGMAVCFDLFSTFKAQPYSYVHDLIVEPAYRNKGIGRALLETVIERARAARHCKITLEVRADNLGAQQLYSKLGFAACEPDMWFRTRYL